jgi:hypothetical protein
MRTVRTECTLEQITEFMDCVREAGIQIDPWYEVTPYDGPAKRLPAALYVKRGLLSKKHILGADSREDMEAILCYIKNNPECHDWRLGVDTGQWKLEPGYFAIVEMCAFRGGDRQRVIKLLRRFGLDQEVIDNTLNDRSERLLGYTLCSDADESQQLARVMEVGANAGGYISVLAVRAGLLDKIAKYVPATSECTWGRIVRRHALAGTKQQFAKRFEDAYQLEPSCEPVWELLSQDTVNRLVDEIMDSATLHANVKVEACLALGVTLEGCIPPPEGIMCLGRVFDSQIIDLLRTAEVKQSGH